MKWVLQCTLIIIEIDICDHFKGFFFYFLSLSIFNLKIKLGISSWLIVNFGFFLTDEDEKTILNLENSNKSLSGELREVKKDLSQLQDNLKISENMNLQFENQLNKTIRNLSTVMDEIHTVLKKVSNFIHSPIFSFTF